ncbi:FKBP62 [Symbiodinium sp. CCMP2592]|nr:FKBP62 [Symbiodinium sp. CCMP2592]
MAATSAAAYNLAKKLCQEYEKRKKEEKEMNLKHENTDVHAENNKSEISRKVTEIDYGKHEKTVKELDRQEKEQEYQRKATEAAQWCTLDHEHGPNCKRPPTSCSQDHQKEWQIYERSTEEKIAAAERFRQEGNEAYRKRNFGLAAVHYRKALLHFDYTFAETEDLQNQVDAVKLPCLLNLAACKCQQEDWDEVLTQCRQALEINPRAVKAHYRVGLAYLARDEFELAKDALTSAHEIEPSNPDIAAALKQLKKNMEDYKTRRRDVAKEMLSGKDQVPDVAEQVTAQPADATGAETEEACWIASVLVWAHSGRKRLCFFQNFVRVFYRVLPFCPREGARHASNISGIWNLAVHLGFIGFGCLVSPSQISS